MKRDEDMERRLKNWGRWHEAGRLAGPISISSIYVSGVGGGRGRLSGATMPVLDSEAMETDDAVDRLGLLHPEHRDALRAAYLRRGPKNGWLGGMEDDELAARLRIAERTYQERVAEGTHLLKLEIAAHRLGVQRATLTPVGCT